MITKANSVDMFGFQAYTGQMGWTAFMPGLIFRFLQGVQAGILRVQSPAIKTPELWPEGQILLGCSKVVCEFCPAFAAVPLVRLSLQGSRDVTPQTMGWRFPSTLEHWSYRQAQVSTDMLGYTFKTIFRFSSRKRTPREFILSGTQQGSGMPGTMPTALTMLWMVA